MTSNARTSPSHPRKATTVRDWDLETDIAVVGFGGAGGCAAIGAADAGAEVVIFELASASGGSTALSSAEIYMGGSGGTRVQQACGFEDSTEDMFQYMMASAGPQADPAKIRNYCEQSTAHFQWLVDLYMDGRLKLDELITKYRPLDEINEAFDDMNRGVTARTVLTFR